MTWAHSEVFDHEVVHEMPLESIYQMWHTLTKSTLS